MSLSHSPSIVMDGLAVYFDSANIKSIAAEQTINLLYTNGNVDWAVYGLTGTVSLSTITANQVYRITNATASTVQFRIAFNSTKLVNGLSYNLSYKYNFISGGSIFAMTDWCDTSLSNVINTDFESYKYSSAFGTRATYDSTYRFMDFNISANTVVEIFDIQLEQKQYATPFINGTRDEFYDISGNNRNATLSNTTYSSPALVFNGTTSQASFDISGIDFSTGQTLIMALMPNEADGSRRNPYNNAYGGYGTITHESNGNFNYYHGTNGANAQPYQGTYSNFTVEQNEKSVICVSRGATNVKWYKNESLINTVSNTYPVAVSTTNAALIGNGYAGRYSGNIYFLLMYTRQLSDQEVIQNFNALRGRYGL